MLAESSLLLSCLHGSVRVDILHLGCRREIMELSLTFTAEHEICDGKGNWFFKNSKSRAAERTSLLGYHMTG